MLGRLISIGLIFFLLTGGILVLTSCEEEIPAEVPEQTETDMLEQTETEKPEESEPEAPEVMTIGDLISTLVIQEYQSSIEGKEPTLKEGTAVQVLGRVEDFRVVGEYPHFRGEVDLKPYYCSSRLQCIFEDEAVEQLRSLEIDQDVVIQGRYGNITCYEFSRDTYYLVSCSLLSIESPQTWIIPMPEGLTADAISAEYFSNWDVQSGYRKGELVRIFGRVYSVSIRWGYLEGIWGDLLASRQGERGVVCTFQGEKVHEIANLPERQDVIIEGEYNLGSENYAYLNNCSLVYP